MDILRDKSARLFRPGYLVAGVLALSATLCFGQTKNSCLDCHGAMPEPLGVAVETFSQDIHAQKGLTCVSCHGGDANSDDPEKAMSRTAGWTGKANTGKSRSCAAGAIPTPRSCVSTNQVCEPTNWGSIGGACTEDGLNKETKRSPSARTVTACIT